MPQKKKQSTEAFNENTSFIPVGLQWSAQTWEKASKVPGWSLRALPKAAIAVSQRAVQCWVFSLGTRERRLHPSAAAGVVEVPATPRGWAAL